MRHTNLLLVTILILTAVLSACAAPAQMAGSGSANTSAGTDSMASASMLPKEVQSAPARVKTAYQFAMANPDALKNVPCYCGCGSMGHTSNLSCYVKDRKGDEITGNQIAFDQHALGCSLCVDISQDVMRMTGEGKSPQAIRAEIVAAYSKFGPANQ